MQHEINQQDEQLNEHQLKYCSQLLTKLKKNVNAYPFLEPVDPVKLGIPEYTLKIKNPMDMSTIRKKLDARMYKNYKEFDRDMRLMFNNCYVYNPTNSHVYDMGKALESVYDDYLKAMPTDVAKKRRKTEIIVPDRSKVQKRNIRTTETMKSEDFEFCIETLNEIYKGKYKSFVWPFYDPVDSTIVPTYYTVIKNPMDLRTLKEKFDQKLYQSVEDFYGDLRLIIENCYKFNEEGSEVYNCGVEFSKLIESLYMKYEPKDIKNRIVELKKKILAYTKELKQLEAKMQTRGEAIPSVKTYNISDRIDLGNRIINLTKEQTEHVARIVQKHSCGEFIENNEIEVDLRLIPDFVCEEIDNYLSKIELKIYEEPVHSNVILG